MPDVPSRVVVIGASAGGLPALTTLLRELPADVDACVLVVLHTRSDGNGVLPEILGRASRLQVAFASQGDPIEAGRLYVARPDWHLLVDAQRVALAHGPRENGFRPAIDPLFRTAAKEFGARVIGVILSGALGDGTYGLNVVKQHGGVTIVQDPNEAIIPVMPTSALANVQVDHVLVARDIAQTISRLSAESAMAKAGKTTTALRSREARAATTGGELEPQLQAAPREVASMNERFGAPSGLTCPDCGGALWEIKEDGGLRYQCHVGHQYSPDSLDIEQRDAVDSALWSAVRVLEEHAELKLRMARRAHASGLSTVSNAFEEGARDAHLQAQHIRGLLFSTSTNGLAAPAHAGIDGVAGVADAGQPPPRKRRRGTTSRARGGRKR